MAPALALDGHHRLTLRGYQQEAIDRILAAQERGVRRQLGVAGVGAGKTIVFVSLAARMNVRTLIIAHRDELIQQAAAKVRLVWPDADLGIVKAERRDFGAQDVIVASIQSLTPGRLARMGRFGLVIIDEAHRTGAPSYGRAIDALDAGKPGGPLLLGVTATPQRSDGKGLDAHYDEIVFDYDMLWLIRQGYLVDLRAIEVQMKNLRLEDVQVRQGDYVDGQLGAALTAAHAPWWIAKAWKAHAANLKTLVFMPTVDTAQAVASEFMAQGVRAICVTGATPTDERRRMLRDFSEGRYQVLSNVGIATEGYDEPSIECVVNGAPTKSKGLFTQRIGRGVRLYPGKSECLVLDVTPTSSSIDLCSVASLAGLPRKAMARRSLVEAVEAKEAAEAVKRPATALPRADADMLVRDVDLFRQHGAKPGKVSWGKTRAGAFAASAGKVSVVMEPSRMTVGAWCVATISEKGERTVLMDGVPLGLATSIAEDHVRANAPASLVDRARRWRKDKPTDKQLAFAQRLGIGIPPGATKGDVSAMVDARMAEIRASKARRTAR